MTRVLVTGAAGTVGRILIRALRGDYELVATDRVMPASDLRVPFVEADIVDAAAMRRLCAGVDVVLHLAADRRPDASWDSLLPNNVVGSQNVFQAAVDAGCRRVVFASSLWAVQGRSGSALPTPNGDAPADNPYGMSKATSEQLAQSLAESSQTSFVCLRIGWVHDRLEQRFREGSDTLPFIITDRDVAALFQAAINAPSDLRFGIFVGLSNNAQKAADIEPTRQALGYDPQDDSFALASPARGHWPSLQQELLLKAALSEGPAAIDAWTDWESRVNWDDHLEEGSYRLLPLVYDNLQRAGFEHPVMQKLKGIYRLAWYKNETAQTRLVAILRALREVKVRTLVLKGAALIGGYYSRSGLRPMSDIDVLVPDGQIATAVGCLEALGWTWHENAVGVSIESLVSARHALMLEDPDQNQIDLHWHVLQDNCQPGADDAFWEGSIDLDIGGEPTRALNPTDQLFHICVHGARWNELPSIRWVADAMMVLRKASADIDWSRFLDQAGERMLVLPAQSTMTYLAETFAAPVPPEFLRRLNSHAVSRRELAEFAYRSSDHRRRLFGYLPIIWYDYLRSRAPFSKENELWGFARYLSQRVGAPTMALMPIYLLATSPRVKRLIGR